MIFLDLIITIDRSTGTLKYKPYTKPENFFLYIPPNSAHPPGTCQGMIVSMLKRKWEICTDTEDYVEEVHLLHQRLMKVGYKTKDLYLWFKNVSKKISCNNKLNKTLQSAIKPALQQHQRLFLHPTYHPKDMPRKCMQEIYKETYEPML